MMNFSQMKIVATLSQLALLIFSAMVSQSVYAKWDEERDMTTNGKEELVYYFKTNDQGQKLRSGVQIPDSPPNLKAIAPRQWPFS